MTEPTITWYVSRRVDLPLRDASDALDELVARAAPGGPEQADARLPGALAVRPIATLPGIDRRLRGSLPVGGLGGPVRIELELVAWSHEQSEISLRPAARRPTWRTDRYFNAAVGALQSLDGALCAVAERGAADQIPVRRAS